MSKIAVIYWSGTGNTQAMAEAVAEGAKGAGAQVDLYSVSETSAGAAAAYDTLALGCPAMGAEVLEESEFEPFFYRAGGQPFRQKGGVVRLLRLGRRAVDARLGRPPGCQRCRSMRRAAYRNEAPDEDGLAQCRALGAALAGA